MQQNMAPPNRIFGAQHVTAPPPNRAPTNRAPDPREADEMLADENQRLAENKRRARLAERMRDREDQLAHMANYALGGADGGEQDLALLVRNQQQNLQNGRRLLGIDQQEQARKPQAMCVRAQCVTARTATQPEGHTPNIGNQQQRDTSSIAIAVNHGGGDFVLRSRVVLSRLCSRVTWT